MFGLAAEIPTPILSDILGLGTTTAVRWATLAARTGASTQPSEAHPQRQSDPLRIRPLRQQSG